MPTIKKSTLYINDLFEVHKWGNPLLPFIFHTDLAKKTYRGYGNWHDSLEILQVIEGGGSILCDSVRHEVGVGDMIVINSNEVHRIYTESEMRYHCFIIGIDFCRENGFDITSLKYKSKIKDKKADELLKSVIDEIDAEKKGKDFSVPAVRACALSLLVYLSRNYSVRSDNAKGSSISDGIRSGLEYINNNFSEPLTLEDIAQKTGISKYHFIREFKHYTGYTVITYINTLRCERAKKLLENTSYSVGEVAEMCGFENLSYFSKTFKMYAGCLPSKYGSERKMCLSSKDR